MRTVSTMHTVYTADYHGEPCFLIAERLATQLWLSLAAFKHIGCCRLIFEGSGLAALTLMTLIPS